MRRWVFKKMIAAGRFLFESGLVDLFAGNLSYRDRAGRIYVTRSGAPLALLSEKDVLVLKEDRPCGGRPSSELVVHRRTYELTDLRALAHAHPPAAVALSLNLTGDFFEPIDSEGRLLLGRVPLIRVKKPTASRELAEAVARALKISPCALVSSHGAFCGGEDPLKAAGFVASLEFSAKVAGGLR